MLDASRLNVPSTASLLALVRKGVGITLLPRLAVSETATGLAFLPLKDSKAQRQVWLISQPKQRLSPAARALAQAIRDARIPGGLGERRFQFD